MRVGRFGWILGILSTFGSASALGTGCSDAEATPTPTSPPPTGFGVPYGGELSDLCTFSDDYGDVSTTAGLTPS